GVVPGIALHHHVIPGPPALDEPQFGERCREFAGLVVPCHGPGFGDHPGALVTRVLGTEVREQAGPDALRLADVQHLAILGDEAVGSRPVLRLALHHGEHRVAACLDDGGKFLAAAATACHAVTV